LGLNARSERFLFVLDDSFDKLDRRIVVNAILHVLNNNTKNEQYMKPDYIHELVKNI